MIGMAISSGKTEKIRALAALLDEVHALARETGFWFDGRPAENTFRQLARQLYATVASAPDPTRRSTTQELRDTLRKRFPWLGTSDEDDIPYPSGADTIAALEDWYRELGQ